MAPMIRAASLRGFVALVERLGEDAGDYLRRFGISADSLASDDGLVSITAHDLMLDAAATELDCPDLGLRLAEEQDLSILGPLAVAIGASGTAAEALECASRFLFVHSPALDISVRPDPRGARGVVLLAYRKDLRESPYSPQAMELGLGLFHHIAEGLLGASTGLRSIDLAHAPVSPVSRYTEFFGVDVRFGSPVPGLRVDRRLLSARFADADQPIRRLALDHLQRNYPDPRTRISAQVRLALAEALGVTAPSLAATARLLATHPRTLQRRLAAEGATFGQIFDDVRREAAHRHLTTTDLPASQVAAMVGFAEQSALSHAVRRWYGTSPRALRAGAAPP
jgi:AraC-like DNA-binding protein